MHTVQELEMFIFTKKIFRRFITNFDKISDPEFFLSLIPTIGTVMFVNWCIFSPISLVSEYVVTSILSGVVFFFVNGAIASGGQSSGCYFIPLWLQFIYLAPFTLMADIAKWFGQSIYKTACSAGSWFRRRNVTRQMEKSSLNLIRSGHKPDKIEPLTLRGGPKQVITAALVNKGAIEFITDQLGRKEMINGPDGEEGILIPEYRISEDGERATAMVTYRLIKDSQTHPNVKKDEVYFRYFVLAFTLDRRKGTLETRVLEEGTDSPSTQVLDGAAKSLWGEQIQRELDKLKPFDTKLHEFMAERQISSAVTPAQQADGV